MEECTLRATENKPSPVVHSPVVVKGKLVTLNTSVGDSVVAAKDG